MRQVTLTFSFLLISGLVFSQNLSSSYLFNTPSLFNPGFTGIENYLDVKIGGQRLDVPVQNPPGTAYILINGTIPGKTKTRGPKKVRYKSPYDIDKLANEIPSPSNGIRISNMDLYRKNIRDSIRKSVMKLDRKQKEELRKKLQKQRFEASFKHGFGAQLFTQKSGPFKSTLGSGNYSLHLPINNQWMLSLGTALIFSNSRLDINELSLTDAADPVLEKYSGGFADHTSLALSNGLVLYSSNFNIGYSMQNSLKLINPDETAILFESITNIRHHLSAYGTIPMDMDLQWQNGLHLRTNDNNNLTTQLVSRVIYKNRYGLGGGYDFEDRYSINTFIIISDYLKLNYIIDLPASSAGTNIIVNELSLNFLINRGGAPSPYFY